MDTELPSDFNSLLITNVFRPLCYEIYLENLVIFSNLKLGSSHTKVLLSMTAFLLSRMCVGYTFENKNRDML